MIVDATTLTTFEVGADGTRVRLNLLDSDGQPLTLTLPVSCIAALLMTLPAIQTQALQILYGDASLRMVYPAASWKLESADEPGCVILTLATGDGFKVSFSIKPTDLTAIAGAAERSEEAARLATN